MYIAGLGILQNVDTCVVIHSGIYLSYLQWVGQAFINISVTNDISCR